MGHMAGKLNIYLVEVEVGSRCLWNYQELGVPTTNFSQNYNCLKILLWVEMLSRQMNGPMYWSIFAWAELAGHRPLVRGHIISIHQFLSTYPCPSSFGGSQAFPDQMKYRWNESLKWTLGLPHRLPWLGNLHREEPRRCSNQMPRPLQLAPPLSSCFTLSSQWMPELLTLFLRLSPTTLQRKLISATSTHSLSPNWQHMSHSILRSLANKTPKHLNSFA